MYKLKVLTHTLVAFGAAICASASVSAADYPSQPVHMYVGYSVGGSTDFVARFVGAKLAERWGQPVVIENKPGADSTIAGEFVAHSAPDGYSLQWISNSHVIAPSFRKVNYDPVKSFEPIAKVVSFTDVLVVNSAVPANSLKEFIALAKSKPGELTYGSSGANNLEELQMRLFMKQAGIQMVGAHYSGGAPLVVALLGNEVQIGLAPLSSAPHIKSGKLRALATPFPTRIPTMPDVPTFTEAGALTGFDKSDGWIGVVAPAGTPKDIVDKIYRDIADIMKMPDVLQKLSDYAGFIANVETPEQYTKTLVGDAASYAAILKEMGE